MKYHLRETLCAFTGFVRLPLCFGCRWSQMYEENGRYSVWIQIPKSATNPSCTHTVDQAPNNVSLRKYRWRTWALSRCSRSRRAAWLCIDSRGTRVHSTLRPTLWSTLCLIESVKRRKEAKITWPLCILARLSLGTWCVLIRWDMLSSKGDKRQAFFVCLKGLALRRGLWEIH